MIASHEADVRAIGARRLTPVYRLSGPPPTIRRSTRLPVLGRLRVARRRKPSPSAGWAGDGCRRVPAGADARPPSDWAIIRGMKSPGAAATPMPPAYRTVLTVGGQIMRWSRLAVTGLDALPTSGPTLLIANHDSYWDPIAIAVAARSRRQIRALAKSTLWKVRLIGRLMDSMGHIPIERGATNESAVSTAIEALAAGACIGVFPEGTRSLGSRTARAQWCRAVGALPFRKR